ncbi:hypothetical protein ES703_66161 [subsurface metagenome]
MLKYKFKINKSKKDSNKYKVVTEKPKYRMEYPKFRFSYYLCDNKNISFKCIKDVKKFYLLFKNFKKYCCLTWEQIISNSNYHAHDVIWALDTLPDAIKKVQNKKEIRDKPLFQFNPFTKKDPERIIGFFDYDNTFQVLGIDKKHNIYPGK